MANIADISIKIKGWSKLVDAGVVEVGDNDTNGKEKYMRFVNVETHLGYDYTPNGWDGFVNYQDDDTVRIDTTGRWSMDDRIASLLRAWAEELGIDYQWIAIEPGCDYQDYEFTEELGLEVRQTIEDYNA